MCFLVAVSLYKIQWQDSMMFCKIYYVCSVTWYRLSNNFRSGYRLSDQNQFHLSMTDTRSLLFVNTGNMYHVGFGRGYVSRTDGKYCSCTLFSNVSCNLICSGSLQSFNWPSFWFPANKSRNAYREMIHAWMRVTQIELLLYWIQLLHGTSKPHYRAHCCCCKKRHCVSQQFPISLYSLAAMFFF